MYHIIIYIIIYYNILGRASLQPRPARRRSRGRAAPTGDAPCPDRVAAAGHPVGRPSHVLLRGLLVFSMLFLNFTGTSPEFTGIYLEFRQNVESERLKKWG